jgi:hypothetical protein
VVTEVAKSSMMAARAAGYLVKHEPSAQIPCANTMLGLAGEDMICSFESAYGGTTIVGR